MLNLVRRLLRDAEFFKSRITKLEGAADLGDSIIKMVNSKTVAEEPKSPTITASAEKPADESQPEAETT